jgi:hypothetical protein
MIGGLAVRNNLLCMTWSAGTGHVFLYDLEARERVSSWRIPMGPSGFSDAGGVAMDRDCRIYVADTHNDCVRRFNAFGQHLGDLGFAAPVEGDRGRDRQGVLDRPHAVATHLDRIIVVMGDRPRRRAVQCFHKDGQVMHSFAARGDASQKWSAPRGVWADERGVVISDTLRGRLQMFRHDGTFVQEVDANTKENSSRPGHILRMPDATSLVVDHCGVESELVAIAADGTRRDLAHLSGLCSQPLALASDDQHRTYVLDHGGERVVRLSEDLSFDEVLVDLAEHDPDAHLDHR